MKKVLTIFALAIVTTSWPLQAQNSIEQVLEQVASNNKALQASSKLTEAMKQEARIGNSLPDPTISYERLYGSPEELGKSGELTIAQSFDFPTVYSYKNKIARLKSTSYDWQATDLRQQILLQAKEICLELISLNQQKAILDTRYEQAQKLSQLYNRRVESGESTVLEANKIDLEMMNVKTEARLNEASRSARLKELEALNGNEPITFDETQYPAMPNLADLESIRTHTLSASPMLNSLKNDQLVNEKQISLSRAEWLPKFEVGYRYDTGVGEKFNGFMIGMSIPLYENRHKVKQAKALSAYSNLQTSSQQLQLESELYTLYTEAKALKISIDEYQKLLKKNSLDLLMKALDSGQISMIEYFVEVSTIYESMKNALQLENQYYKTVAKITRYQL